MRSNFFTLAFVGALSAVPVSAATPALGTPPPPDYKEVLTERGGPDDASLATAKDLTAKEYTVQSKGNGPLFAGGTCPSAGFLGVKPWRARVAFEQTASGRIVYTGTGQQCVTFGQGRVEYEDGSVYEGRVGWLNKPGMNGLANFEPAVPRGTGKFTLPDGTTVESEWARGELTGPVTVTKPGAAPQVGVMTTLAALRSGVVPSAADPATAALVWPAPAGGAVAASAAVAGAPAAAAAPFAPATPFAPAGFAPAGAAAVAATGPGKAGPQPILGNTGKYMCPYTEDGVVALWVDKAVKARMGGAIGGMAGAEAGKELFKHIPMFGGMFGKAAGDKMGREIAIKMAGGWEFITSNSDQSFDDANDYAAWMRANYAGTEHYTDVVAAIKELYPELKTIQF